MSPRARRLVLVIAAGIAVLAGVSIYADTSALGDRLAGFGWWAFAAALALALLNYALRLVRWSLYLSARGLVVPLRLQVLVFLAGFALSITPGKLGELIKSYLLRESAGIPVTRSAPIVIAERVTDLIALLVLGVIGVAIYGVARGMVAAGALVIAAGLVVLAWPRLARAVIALVCRPRPLRRFEPRLLAMYGGLAALLRPRPLCWACGLGAAAWLAECVGFSLIANALPGADVPLALATLIYAATTIAGALSFLPGGLVVTEASMILLLVQASRGMDHTAAAAATILIRLATLWFAVLIGLVALAVLRRVAPAAARALDRAESEPEPATHAGT
ncbi:lysylphosphatidylglycerol synthase transmembrane domain-containing protein [Haliangium sp.]|uniref:lysylphosphatidylglycerol synthase transmembrane domain-containing protein n=1 Tax=Haliangium sp. TaxID=2663208 RepID=UPI003D133600